MAPPGGLTLVLTCFNMGKKTCGHRMILGTKVHSTGVKPGPKWKLNQEICAFGQLWPCLANHFTSFHQISPSNMLIESLMAPSKPSRRPEEYMTSSSAPTVARASAQNEEPSTTSTTSSWSDQFQNLGRTWPL